MIGAGVNGRAAARTFLARGRAVSIWDLDRERARAAADELGASVAASREEALAADIVVTVTPGPRRALRADGSLRPGQHVSLMGADGPGKAEIAAESSRAGTRPAAASGTARTASLLRRLGAGEPLAATSLSAVEAGLIGREDVTQLGAVLAGEAPGRQSRDDITVFDSTGPRDPGSGDRDRLLRERASSTCATLEL